MSLLLLALLLSPPTELPAQQPWSRTGVARTIVFGDVHGAYDELTRLLQATGIVSESLSWTGGATHLVSLGDLLDRGPDSRKVLDLLKRLQAEAAEDGGEVHIVLGNHEMMNLLGDLRYLTAADYAAYAADETPEVRDSAFSRYLARQPPSAPPEEARRDFDARFPAGYFARRLAFEPGGEYGEWLLSFPAILRINDVAFVHGGLSELFSRTSPEVLNQRVRDQIERHLALRRQLVDSGVLQPWSMGDDGEVVRERLRVTAQDSTPSAQALAALLSDFLNVQSAPELGLDGPAWYRGAPYCNAFLERHIVDAALETLEAGRIVIGHTVSPDRRVRALFDGRVLMLDTGMLGEYYQGRPSALILTAAGDTVHYLDPVERSAPEADRADLEGLTEAELTLALAEGQIELDTTAVESDSAWHRVRVHHNGTVLAAAFRPRDATPSADRELAAYHLDSLLGFALVPPTVLREFGGSEGALQLRYPASITETQRLRDNPVLGEWCSIDPQATLARTFDYLIANRRTSDDVVYRVEFPTVKLINHAAAFDPGAPPVPSELTPTPNTREALTSIDRAALEEAVGEWLDGRQLDALLARRDELLGGTPGR